MIHVLPGLQHVVAVAMPAARWARRAYGDHPGRSNHTPKLPTQPAAWVLKTLPVNLMPETE